MASVLTIRWRPFGLLGISIGLLLSVALGVFCPAADMKPEDSRVLMAVVGMFFLVPASIFAAFLVRLALYCIREQPYLGFVWAAAVLLFTLFVALSAHIEQTSAKRFGRLGRSTYGKVLESHPEFHNTLLVSYTIAGVDYRSQSTSPGQARDYNGGETIQVYYYAAAPGEGFFVEPRWRPDLAIMEWILVAGVGPFFIVGVLGGIALRTKIKLA